MATLNELFETYVNDNFSGVMSEAAIVKAYELLLGLTGDFPAKDERVQFWVDKELTVSDFVDEFLAAAARLSTENAAAWGETTAGRTAVVTAAQDEVATATTLEEVGAAVATARAENPVVTGETFTLTASNDSITATAKNDQFDATAVGSLGDDDVILDSSSEDSDTLNAVVNTTSASPRIQNVEVLNIDGQYASTGLDLASTTNAKELNLNTSIVGGTATVLNASSLNAAAINAGANISTLNVTATASGTRDAVEVDAGSASTVKINGGAGADNFNVTVADGATVTVDGAGSVDNVKVNVGATATVTSTTGDAETVTISAAEDSVVTLSAALGVLGTDKMVLNTGSNLEVKAAKAVVDAGIITTSGGGTTTLNITDATAGESLAKSVVSVVELSAAAGTGVTVNEGSIVNLTADQGAATLNIDNADGDLTTGTLLLNVSESQTTSTTTGAKVDTLVLSATPDAAADTANGAVITLADLTLNSATSTVVINGSDNLKITSFGNQDGDEVVSAAAMTGKLTIGGTDAAGTFVLGSGNDDVTVNFASRIDGNDGDDKLTGGTAADTINGGAGNDTIAGGATAVNTIDAGAGDDTVTVTAADKVTLGAGADTLKTAVNIGAVVADFNSQEDVIALTGTMGGAVDLSAAISTAAETYDLDGDSTDDFTLTGVELTSVESFVKLDSATYDGNITGGDLADTFGVDTAALTGTAVTFEGGKGADVITLSTSVADSDDDTIVIAEGDSLVDGYDSITNFHVSDGAAADFDTLDLASTTVASNVTAADGTDFGAITTHTISSGIVTFNKTLAATDFSDAVDYLAENIADGETVALEFGGNSYVFQGGATADTLVELVGLTGLTAVDTTAAANTIVIA